MYENELNEMLLKDTVSIELLRMSCVIELDEMMVLLNEDSEYLKRFDKRTDKVVNRVKNDKYTGRFKEIMIWYFEKMAEDNKKFIEARERTNGYFRTLVGTIKDDIKRKKKKEG